MAFEYKFNGINNLRCDMNGNFNYNNHPWNIWYENQTKENAQAVLDLIKNS